MILILIPSVKTHKPKTPTPNATWSIPRRLLISAQAPVHFLFFKNLFNFFLIF